MQPELHIAHRPGTRTIRVGGSISSRNASAFSEALRRDVATLADDDQMDLDLDDLELEDGPAVSEAVNAIRSLLERGHLTVRRAPQMLAHTLYKAGMLDDARLDLVAPREEEASAP